MILRVQWYPMICDHVLCFTLGACDAMHALPSMICRNINLSCILKFLFWQFIKATRKSAKEKRCFKIKA